MHPVTQWWLFSGRSSGAIIVIINVASTAIIHLTNTLFLLPPAVLHQLLHLPDGRRNLQRASVSE